MIAFDQSVIYFTDMSLELYLAASSIFIVFGCLLCLWASYKKLYVGLTTESINNIHVKHVITVLISVLCFFSLITFVLSNLPSHSSHGWSLFINEIVFFSFVVLYVKNANINGIFKQNNCYVKLGLFTYLMYIPWAAIGASLSKLILSQVYEGSDYESAAQLMQRNIEWDTPIFFALAMTTALTRPILEEIIFRGIIQNYSTKSLGPIFGIAITSILFSLIHFKMGYGIANFEIIIRTFIFSLFAGYLYLKTKSLISCSVFHITNNILYLIPLILEKLEIFPPP